MIKVKEYILNSTDMYFVREFNPSQFNEAYHHYHDSKVKNKELIIDTNGENFIFLRQYTGDFIKNIPDVW